MKTFLYFSFFLMILLPVLGAEQIDLRRNADIQALFDTVPYQQDHLAWLRSFIELDRETTIQLVSKKTDSMQITHYRYNQLFRNVRVWGQQIVISERGLQSVGIRGFLMLGMEKSVNMTRANISKKEAIEFAQNHHATATREAWAYSEEEGDLFLKLSPNNIIQLCYVVKFFGQASEKVTQPTYGVSAEDGNILWQSETLRTLLPYDFHQKTHNPPQNYVLPTPCVSSTFVQSGKYDNGTGPGGNAKIGKYFYGNQRPSFPVQYDGSMSHMETAETKILDLNHSYSWPSNPVAFSFAGKDNTYKEINQGYCPINDAQFYAVKSCQIYPELYGFPAMDGQLNIGVHYGSSVDNAYSSSGGLLFGDGRTYFYPLVCLDVVAHELGHTVTSNNSDLYYDYQSGGMNEAFSDIAGEATEYYALGSNDWLVGADIMKTLPALRFFQDPTLDGSSIGSANDYYDGLDVHYSSGVYNKAFYLLATTKGWNTQTAFDVFVRCQRYIWISQETFVSGAQGAVDAARDLGYNTDDVIRAFEGVDVYIKDVGPQPPSNLTIRIGVESKDVVIQWQDNASSEEKYIIERLVGTMGVRSSFETIATVPANQEIYRDPIEPGNTYTYRVYAIDAEGNRSYLSTAQSVTISKPASEDDDSGCGATGLEFVILFLFVCVAKRITTKL